jgi:hypothetical protein
MKTTSLENQDKLSYASLVRLTMQESPEPLSVAEVLRRVNRVRPVETRSPESTIRSALAQCYLIANDGEGRYGWFPRMLKGSVVRAPLIASDLEGERIIIDDDVRDLLWPSFFVSQNDLRDRNPVNVVLPGGIHTSLPLDFFGEGIWGTNGSPKFWKWLETCRPTTGDDLIIEAIDAEKRKYRVSFEGKAGRNLAALYARTEEVEHAAEDHFWRGRAHGAAIWTLARHLLAAGYYKDRIPPESISLIWNRVYAAHLIGEAMIEPKRKTRRKLRKVYQLKISLLESNPPIWRRLIVADNTALADLHWIFQLAMGWTNSHLHQFIVDEQYYSDPDFGLDEEDFDVNDESMETLGSVLAEEDAPFIYEYDFGDNWRHLITIEQVLDPSEVESFPRCIDGGRSCPPEDVGGVWGYENFLEAIADPAHEDHEQFLVWAGGSFDPERFSAERINRLLRRYPKSK